MTKSIFEQISNQAIAAPFWANLIYDTVSDDFLLLSCAVDKPFFSRLFQMYQLTGSVQSMRIATIEVVTTQSFNPLLIQHAQQNSA